MADGWNWLLDSCVVVAIASVLCFFAHRDSRACVGRMRVIRSLIWVPGFSLKSLPRRSVLCAGQLPRQCIAFPLRPSKLWVSLSDLLSFDAFVFAARGLGKTPFSGHVSDASLRSRPRFVKDPRRSDLAIVCYLVPAECLRVGKRPVAILWRNSGFSIIRQVSSRVIQPFRQIFPKGHPPPL